jgi:hypothetical protein
MTGAPVGYLVTGALACWCTLMALAPLSRPLALGAMSFLVGFVLNELPFLAFCYLLAATLLAAGAIDSPGGWAAAGLVALATAGLLAVAWRGAQARPAVDRALDEGLGAGWRAALDAGTAARLRRRPPYARILLAPVLFRRRDVERTADLSYGGAGRANLLDVYRHRSRHRFHALRFEAVVDAIEAFTAWVRSPAAARRAGSAGAGRAGPGPCGGRRAGPRLSGPASCGGRECSRCPGSA